MKTTLFWASAIGFTLSAHLGWLTYWVLFSRTSARAVENCIEIGTIETIQGEAFKVNQDRKEPLNADSIICAENRLESTPTSSLILRCLADNQTRQLLPGIALNSTELCPVVLRCEDTADPHCGRGGSQIIAQSIPEIITPRNTRLLNPKPTLAWKSVPNASTYTITIEEDIEGEIWKTETQETQLIYDGDIALTPGLSYTLTVKADSGSEVAEERFNILSEEEVSIVEVAIDDSENFNTLLPQLAVYKQYLLRAEAIQLLEKTVNRDAQSSTLYRELGDLYWDVGRIDVAEEAYVQSINIAFEQNDLHAQALGKVRLGELYQIDDKENEAKQQFQNAKELYEEAGALDLSRKVETLLN
ncbi:hypothetical protein PJF56_07980 [Roseofilum sp. BLCC_M91]|uniref:Tetratricopeptide repeat protein n=1 Tax=Roseofilum halophilum BLCC-M91 TaxID=3022259 RepID=A0ABT7BHY3_9CYAN|nr:hypothetical protein [Roseofilum halophilum]MDJ1178798.1 hypothetical protein [Roseofilum halophilum BLCC-M91]